MNANDPNDEQEQSPIECKFCDAPLTGVRPIDVMYTVELSGVDDGGAMVFLCDECAPDEK